MRDPPTPDEIIHVSAIAADAIAFLEQHEKQRRSLQRPPLSRPYRRLSPTQLNAAYTTDNAKPPRRG